MVVCINNFIPECMLLLQCPIPWVSVTSVDCQTLRSTMISGNVQMPLSHPAQPDQHRE